jgi:hydroxymethylpyrimidine/phosphomethylpyrimidine kinase
MPAGRVLAIAGSDSGGGAGIQADIKTITVLGGYAATAVTAVTAQDTHRVHEIMAVPPALVARQIALVLADIGADAVKTGMLGTGATIAAVCDALATHGKGVPVVVDPVLRATGGGPPLLEDAALEILRGRLLPMAAVVTPNLPEAAALTGLAVRDPEGMREAARRLRAMGAAAVLVTGGHLEGDTVTDLLVTSDGAETFTAPRIATRHTHGTGCTLASAIATGLAQGLDLRAAVLRARDFVRAAIAAAPGFGGGHGPLDHGACIRAGRGDAR